MFGAAAVIAVITLFARLVGFLRTAVLGQTLGADCLGSAYTTANAVPNVVFEVVVGGALAGAVVPLLAGAVARGDHELVRASVRALTGWVLLLLVPTAVVVALAAGPIVNVLLGDGGGCSRNEVGSVAASMLAVFAIQIPIYGLTVVAQGTLQAHQRFVAPAVAPLVSSLVVIAAFGAYWIESGDSRGSIGALSDLGLYLLAWGTTIGVLALWVTQWPGLAGRRLLLVRPTLHFPDGVAVRARRLAAAGAATVAAQWLAFGVGYRLANERGIAGAALIYTLAWAVFLLPYAVLAYPVATSAFPRLAAQFDRGDATGFAATCASTLRAVVVAGALGAAGVLATCRVMADVMLLGAPGPDQTPVLAKALIGFAPGVWGFAVASHVSRILYARHRGRLAAATIGGGWVLGVAVAIGTTAAVSSVAAVTALGASVSVGMLVAGVASLWLVRRVVGREAVAGLSRTLTAGLVACVLSAGTGLLVAAAVGDPHRWWVAVALTVLIGSVVVATFGLAMVVLDRESARLLGTRLRRPRAAD